MDSSKIQQQVTNLGNLLVEELKRETEWPDTLSRWMAHYIAEQIAAAESTAGAEKAAAQEKCFRTILALWKHRSSMPSGHRPFEGFEPIFRALQRLDPEAPQPFYHHFTDPREGAAEPGSVRDLMEFVINIDAVTRVLIDTALNEATRKATNDRTLALLKESLSEDSVQDTTVIQRLVEKWRAGTDAAEDEKALLKKHLEDRIKKLGAFCAVAPKVRDNFKKQLRELCEK